MPKLVFLSADFANQGCELPDGRVTLGRGPQNDLVVQHPSVSADHCEFLVNGPEVIIREHGSSNGTYVDEKRVGSQAGVDPGQKIRFGEVIARIEPDPLEGEVPDETTEYTAVIAYKRALKAETGPPRKIPVFPVVFSPIGSSDAGEQTLIAPRPALPLPRPAEAPAAAPRPAAASGRPWLPWVLAVVGVIAAVIAWRLWG